MRKGEQQKIVSASELNQMWQDHAKYKEETCHLVCDRCGLRAHTCHHQFEGDYVLQTVEEYRRERKATFLAACFVGLALVVAVLVFVN